jgi:alpha-L-rhamnosidase
VYNALYYWTLRVVEDLARKLDLAPVAERCATRAESLREAINARLWSEERGAYVDACVDGQQSHRLSQQANAVCIAYDIAPPERWERIFATILDESRLAMTSIGMTSAPSQVEFDEERHVVLAQPFFMHHVHRALVRAGRYDDLVRNIRQRWGAMIEAGATSIWEVWVPTASQCHAWSTTPTFDLSTEVLGVAPLEPGFARVRIAPQPAGLDWARGVFPSVKGEIQVSWEKRGEEFRLSTAIPEGSTAEIALPSRPGGWRAVRVGDVADVLTDSAAQTRAGVSRVMRGEETVTLVVQGPRELDLEAKA